MKKILIGIAALLVSISVFGQQRLLSYEDVNYLIRNNIAGADTFMISKGYTKLAAKPNDKVKKYLLIQPDQTKSEVTLRPDGRRVYISIETNVLEQYNLILNSISQYKTKSAELAPDVTSYDVKNLGNIYITISDSVPYNPIRRDYDIQIVPDKNIVAIY